ncbi:hypothetical protein [Flavobacterium suncheonense]|uniref:GOLD domain-containing protein n=1 Tax=Flavobacterium suncheonense GH29-5 = DSM 17707 TaxID=1121899 RepID=A0A0A2MDR0_9FLAO|nr:hypothetical protein [Flavobacterium suncheonense]KGO90424.1 hypothetical protein Q764_02395 [Flavobacterium suncheonense GH29-5 = DSM 17707]
MKNLYSTLLLSLLSSVCFAQSDFDKILKGSEIVMAGLSVFKVAQSEPKKNTTAIESLCVKNKLEEKITFKITGKDAQDNEVKKELVIQNNGKECLYNLPKGIYTYEVILPNKEVYKKGEYKFDGEMLFTVKKED